MADLGTAAVLASVVVGMMAIPAASQDLGSSSVTMTDLPNISASKSQPRKVSTTNTPTSFSRKVETAFNKFKLSVTSGSAETSLQSPGSRLSVSKTSGKTVWRLETPRGDLTVSQSSGDIVETVETPYGTLKVAQTGKGTSKSFSGTDRERVEKTLSELRELMEKKKQELQDRKDKMVSQTLESDDYSKFVSLTVEPDEPEKVVIRSQLSTPIDLEGWTISDEVSNHTFGDVVVPANGELHVYSADSGTEENKVTGTGISWNNGGDTATLRNSDGDKIKVEKY